MNPFERATNRGTSLAASLDHGRKVYLAYLKIGEQFLILMRLFMKAPRGSGFPAIAHIAGYCSSTVVVVRYRPPLGKVSAPILGPVWRVVFADRRVDLEPLIDYGILLLWMDRAPLTSPSIYYAREFTICLPAVDPSWLDSSSVTISPLTKI